MADWVNDALDDLDQSMLLDYEDYCDICLSAWYEFQGNDGQMVIVSDYIIPAAEQHCEEAAEQWPYNVGPDEYVEALYDCFDGDVIDRAFSDTIGDTADAMNAVYTEADDLQHQHDDLMDMIGGSSEPHSTSSDWTGKGIGGFTRSVFNKIGNFRRTGIR